ncbi:MAG: GNAT family N-acetyltransferase [Tenericutes bacterium]|nr:GNAT family N-acetyltransferase [Mycoplasmatota bacterium]
MRKGFDIFGKEYGVMFRNDIHHKDSAGYQFYKKMILINSYSEDYLYNQCISKINIEITNHELFSFAKKFKGESDIQTIKSVLDFTSSMVRNYDVPFDNMEFGNTEKEIIERGTDWCTDISRIGLAILQCLNIPCRLAILVNSRKAYNGHTLCEAYLDNEYMMIDFTYGVLGLLSKKYSVKDLLKQPQIVKEIYSLQIDCNIDLEYIEGLYDMAALAEYDITKKHDYSISVPNEYYLNMMNLSHDGLWKMGEDMKIDDLIIRKATAEDAKGKGYVHYQSWIETYTGLFPDDVMSRLSLEKSIDNARKYPENTYVAIVDDNIIGFSCYLESRDEDLEDAGEIMAIYILKEYQGQGIGKKLMEVSYKELSNYSKLSLWVLGSNKKSVSFYERQGFIADGKTKMLHGKEVIRMIKRM